MNLQKFYTGEVFDAYEYFGAHLEGDGIVFRTYAPRAERVSVMGEFSDWKEKDKDKDKNKNKAQEKEEE